MSIWVYVTTTTLPKYPFQGTSFSRDSFPSNSLYRKGPWSSTQDETSRREALSLRNGIGKSQDTVCSPQWITEAKQKQPDVSLSPKWTELKQVHDFPKDYRNKTENCSLSDFRSLYPVGNILCLQGSTYIGGRLTGAKHLPKSIYYFQMFLSNQMDSMLQWLPLLLGWIRVCSSGVTYLQTFMACETWWI